MSDRYFTLEEAHRLALREEAQQRALQVSERLDALVSGMSEFEYRDYLSEVADARVLEARIHADKMADVVRISRRNRGEPEHE